MQLAYAHLRDIMGLSIWLKSTPHWVVTTWPPRVQGPSLIEGHWRWGFLSKNLGDMSSLDPSSSGLFPSWKKSHPSGNVFILLLKRNVFGFSQSYWPNHWTRILSRLQQKHRLYQLIFVSLRGDTAMDATPYNLHCLYGRWWFRSDIGHECFHGEMRVE